jgi:ABC-2 type transport system permease protein/oleandomycin transport system permease protein
MAQDAVVVQPGGLGWTNRIFETISDIVAIGKRDLLAQVRMPHLIIGALLQPIVLLVLFRFVLQGALSPAAFHGIPYVDYLIPGIFCVAVMMGAVTTGMSMSTDVKSGILERFRALPMARSGVLAGRTLADLVRTVLVVIVMVAIGLAMGFRVHANALSFLAAMLLVLLFAFALSWLFATIGLISGDPESTHVVSFIVVTTFLFVSSVFVPVSAMASWLQGFAKYQPLSVTASAVRALCIGGPTMSYVIQSLAWCLGILVVCFPLGIWVYRRRV